MDKSNYDKEYVKVSIIVPTYNVENYIDRCLKSLIEQTYNNIEIIVIIDGSTDKSYEKALEWAKIDKRINIIYQENLGSGPARNKGIDNSTGQFIVFMDPDDWIDNNMIEDYINLQKKYGADLVISGYYEEIVYKNKIIIKQKPFDKATYLSQNSARENYIKLFLNEAVNAPTRILYKRSIIEENKIKFPNLRRSQDIVFNYRYFNFVNKVVVDNNIYYHYTIESDTYILKLKHEYYETIAFIYKEINELITIWNVKINNEDISNLNNKFLVLIGYYIESCIIRNEPFSVVFDNDYLCEIAEKSSPNEIYHKWLRYFFINRNDSMIYILVKFKIIIKTKFKFIFNYFKNLKKF